MLAGRLGDGGEGVGERLGVVLVTLLLFVGGSALALADPVVGAVVGVELLIGFLDVVADEARLDSLPKRKWRLEIVGVDEVRMNPLIVNSADLKTGRKFMERLRERRSELRKALETGGTVIWPIVLLREQQLLVDGYCRHSTLQEMNIPEAYGYVGRIVVK